MGSQQRTSQKSHQQQNQQQQKQPLERERERARERERGENGFWKHNFITFSSLKAFVIISFWNDIY